MAQYWPKYHWLRQQRICKFVTIPAIIIDEEASTPAPCKIYKQTTLDQYMEPTSSYLSALYDKVCSTPKKIRDLSPDSQGIYLKKKLEFGSNSSISSMVTDSNESAMDGFEMVDVDNESFVEVDEINLHSKTNMDETWD